MESPPQASPHRVHNDPTDYDIVCIKHSSIRHDQADDAARISAEDGHLVGQPSQQINKTVSESKVGTNEQSKTIEGCLKTITVPFSHSAGSRAMKKSVIYKGINCLIRSTYSRSGKAEERRRNPLLQENRSSGVREQKVATDVQSRTVVCCVTRFTIVTDYCGCSNQLDH